MQDDMDDMQIAELLRLAGRRPEPADFRTARVRAAVEAEWRKAIKRRDRRTLLQWVGLAVAASTVLVAAGKWLLPSSGTTPSSKDAAARALNAVASSNSAVVARLARASGLVTIAENRTDAWRLLGPGGAVNSGAGIRTDAQSRAALALARGQSLRLDMDTLIVIESDARIRLERGSVYLDSGKRGTAGGVEIITPFGTLRDVGTQFEVSLTGSGLRVRVREGEVALTHRDVRVAATQGESVSVTRDGTVTRALVPITGPEWAWASAAAPTFALEDASLEAFLDWVSREEGWDWHFADAASKQRGAGVVLHGSIDKLTPAEALDAVLPTCGMAWRLEGGSLIISLAAAVGR
jgi:ferric-dicitrate binding protein FerR (iron transport regulator)